MTVYVETEFLLSLVNSRDVHAEAAEAALEEYDVLTSPLSYLDLFVAVDRTEVDAVRLVAHLLELVPVASTEDEQIVLKAANYYDEGMSPFAAFHAATAETYQVPVLSSNEGHDTLGPSRLALGVE